MTRIRPCLWFDGKAEEAAGFYVSLLPGSGIDSVQRYSVETPGGKPGQVMAVAFTLAGQPFLALNGGPHYQFTPAISFMIDCEDQAEVDRLWEALGEGGTPDRCGWLRDRYGMSWQIVPSALGWMMSDSDPHRVRRVTEAMLEMVKLDVAGLTAAYEGR